MINNIVIRDAGRSQWLIFDAPIAVLSAYNVADVISVLTEVEGRAQRDQLYAAGYVSYEAASGFDSALTTRVPGDLPLLCFGLFSEPQRLSDLPQAEIPHKRPWNMAAPEAEYREKFEAIKRQIELGNTYQINFTLRQHTEQLKDAWQFFLSIANVAPYSAFIEMDDHAIVSTSPELFFQLDDDDLTCKPMKGTAARGMTTQDDREIKRALFRSVKNRAENVMVTDMLRNDMGRVAKPGSVAVQSLYDIVKYPTLWQMTSTVTAKTSASIVELFSALFPCASITGAPKASSMAIIAELEDSPREIYTGAIGYFGPNRFAQFSVAIRTALVDKRDSTAVYGVGGGIVWDSDADDEYRECLTKAKVLATSAADTNFELLETLSWNRGDSYFLLDLHLQRLRDSAEYFDFAFDAQVIDRGLDELQSGFTDSRYRVRLLLDCDGNVSLASTTLPDAVHTESRVVRLAAKPVDAANPFLYHKTTQRSAYDDALRSVGECDDVLLWNSDGFVTESCSANVVVMIDGELVTPPVSSGLLNGTYRQHLLQQGEIKEREIRVDELSSAANITLINSVRGRMRVQLLGE